VSKAYQNRLPHWLRPASDYTAAHDAVLDALVRVPLPAREVLWALWRLAYRMDRPGNRQLVRLDSRQRALIAISRRDLAVRAGVSEASVPRAVAWLSARGLLAKLDHTSPGPSVYVLGPENKTQLVKLTGMDGTAPVAAAGPAEGDDLSTGPELLEADDLATTAESVEATEAPYPWDTDPHGLYPPDTGDRICGIQHESPEARPGRDEPGPPIRARDTPRGESSQRTRYSVTNAVSARYNPPPDWPAAPDWPMTRADGQGDAEDKQSAEASQPC